MKKLNLCLHCGGKEVALEDIERCPTGPSLGNRHYPIAHITLVDAVRRAADDYGYDVVNEAHALSHEGNRYFGLMQVTPQGPLEARLADEALADYSWVLGLRSSHDQSFPKGIAGGSGVFVCDNLSFLGEVRVQRKHTRFAGREMPSLVAKAFGQLSSMKYEMETRFDAYQRTPLVDDKAKAFVFDAVRTGAVTRQQMLDLWTEWENPSHEEFAARTVWSMFNCVTETLKGRLAAPAIAQRTAKLHLLADAVCLTCPH
jgi:hypothetical protein